MFYKLKVGSHMQGSGTDARFFKANDPDAKKSDGNVIESDLDLVEFDKNKFEVFRGPLPDHVRRNRTVARRNAALRGTGDGNLQDADVSQMSPEELARHAQQMEERAEALRELAQRRKMEQRRQEQEEEEEDQGEFERRKFQAIERSVAHHEEGHEDEGTDHAGQARTARAGEQGVQTPAREGEQPPAQVQAPRVVRSLKIGDKTFDNEKDYHAALDRLSLNDLKKHAEETNTQLHGAVRREDIVKVLKGK